MLYYLYQVANSCLDFCCRLGVDFNLSYCFEIPYRDFEAVEAKQKGDLAKSGVDEPGSPIQE
jgi:hypothetical protein